MSGFKSIEQYEMMRSLAKESGQIFMDAIAREEEQGTPDDLAESDVVLGLIVLMITLKPLGAKLLDTLDESLKEQGIDVSEL